MALPTITLVNLTGGAIDLEQLAITVPASGSIDVTDFDRPDEVLNDEELQVEFDAGNLRINITGGQLTSADTTKTLEQSKAIVQPIHDLDIRHNLAGTTAPVAGDDEDDGYEVGSLWVDTTNDTYYVCADAATGAAVWVANGGTADRIFLPGTVTEALQFAIDFNNQSSWEPNQTTTWVDTIAGKSGTTSNTTVTDGHLNFNGSTSTVDFGTSGSTLAGNFAGGGAVMAWIRPESDGGSNFGRIIDLGIAGGLSNRNWAIFAQNESGGNIQIGFIHTFTSVVGWWRISTAVVPLNEWSHIAVVYDSDDVANDPTIYLNGVSQTITEQSTPVGTPNLDASNDVDVGSNPSAGSNWDGDIEIIEIYDDSKVIDEVIQNYTSERPRFEGLATAPAWSAVLSAGQTSGGTDPVVSVGDVLRGVDVSSGDGGALGISGGDTSSTAISVDGGAVNIVGGSTASTNASGSAQGGDVNITGGAATAVTGQADGGAVNITGATPSTFNGTGGSVTIQSGDGGTGGGNANAGSITIQGGDGAVTTSTGGNISILGGSSTAGFSGGGDITITAGAHSSNSTGGALSMSAGDSVSGSGGDVDINGGDMTGSTSAFDTGGSITLTSGTGTTSPYSIGSIAITVPSPASPTTDNVAAGNVSITAGDNGVRNADGGNVDITAGDTWGFNQRFGGTITLTCGSDNNGSSTSEGGSVVLIPGTSVSGDDGMVKIDGTSTLQMLEKPSVVTGIAAGEGRWWVRNDVPNVPMFTDDAGTDWVLNAEGTTTRQEAYDNGAAVVTNGTAGTFSVTGNETITLSSGTSNTAISGNNVNITSLGPTLPGDINLTGGSATGLTNPGGDIFINAGDGNTTGTGGVIQAIAGDGGTTGNGGAATLQGGAAGATSGTGGTASVTGGASSGSSAGGVATIQAGAGGATGNGGKVNVVAGAGGSTSGNGGDVAISSGTPTDGDGGDIAITAQDGVGTNRSGGAITIDAGDSTNSQNGGAIFVTGGNGTATTVGGFVDIQAGDGRTGGDVRIISGDALTGADSSGNVRIIGSNGGSSPGAIFLTTESDDSLDAPIHLNTQSGFGGQDEEHRTYGASDAVTQGTTNQTVTTLATLSNGENAKVDVKVTGVEDGTDTNVLSFRYEADFYMSGGTLNLLGAYTNTSFSAGAGDFTSNVSFNVGISGGNVLLRVTNNSGSNDYTLNIACIIVTQIGGANS